MAMIQFRLIATFEDESTLEITAGQREMSAWEREPFGGSSANALDDKPVTFLRYLAWDALRRAKLTQKSFSVWSDWCTDVDDISEGEEEVVPTDAGRTPAN
jgi:hypothetical protein